MVLELVLVLVGGQEEEEEEEDLWGQGEEEGVGRGEDAPDHVNSTPRVVITECCTLI